MTETAKTNVIKEPSLIVPKRLTAHKIIVKATSEVIEITNDHRITYGHLEDQFRGLTNPKNIAAGKATGHFYGSNENLAIQCGVSEYTFKKVKKDLKALGLIDWKTPKAKKSGHACEYFVKQLTDIAHNLEFIYQELSNGQPSYDHVRVSGLKTKKTKKAAQPKIEEREDGVQQQEHEQQSPSVSPTEIYSESKPVQRADDVASSSATDDPEQQSGVSQSAGDSCDDVPANDAVNQITIFDEYGVVTEEFINSLTGNAVPNRNADGTLQSIKYVYWVARHSQDERDGIPVRTREEYMAEARPEHIPANLLSKSEPVYDLSNETIPF